MIEPLYPVDRLLDALVPDEPIGKFTYRDYRAYVDAFHANSKAFYPSTDVERGKPTPGIPFTHVLFNKQYKELLKSLDMSFYGKSQDVLLLRRRSILFNPSSARDHLATPFLPVVPRSKGGGTWLRVVLSFLEDRAPGPNCMIFLQDKDCTQISKNITLAEDIGYYHVQGKRVEYVEVPGKCPTLDW